MLLHSIGRSEGPSVTNPWIAKYIFPGGYIPALSEVMPAIERAGLMVTDIEILRLHYAETLKAWRERFLAHREEVERLYDERFCRMWEFYLAASEMAFREQDMMVFQIQLAKRQDVVPITRDYIAQRGSAAARARGRQRRRRCGWPASNRASARQPPPVKRAVRSARFGAFARCYRSSRGVSMPAIPARSGQVVPVVRSDAYSVVPRCRVSTRTGHASLQPRSSNALA